MSGTKEWALGIKSEWKKIIWPSKNDLIRKTGACIAVSAVLGAAIAVMDMGFQNAVNLIAGLF